MTCTSRLRHGQQKRNDLALTCFVRVRATSTLFPWISPRVPTTSSGLATASPSTFGVGFLSVWFARSIAKAALLCLKLARFLQATVQQVLRTQYRDTSADISLSRLRTVRVYVVGDVVEPGAYDISSLSTPLNA